MRKWAKGNYDGIKIAWFFSARFLSISSLALRCFESSQIHPTPILLAAEGRQDTAEAYQDQYISQASKEAGLAVSLIVDLKPFDGNWVLAASYIPLKTVLKLEWTASVQHVVILQSFIR